MAVNKIRAELVHWEESLNNKNMLNYPRFIMLCSLHSSYMNRDLNLMSIEFSREVVQENCTCKIGEDNFILFTKFNFSQADRRICLLHANEIFLEWEEFKIAIIVGKDKALTKNA